jgi:hypothetical protein
MGKLMNMKKTISYLLFLCLLAAACKKETGVAGPAGPAGPQGPDGVNHDTASISGHLSLFSALSLPLPDSGGVTVTLKSGSLQRTTTTDAAGHYIFYGLERGTYDLTYQKSGFGIMKVFGVSHAPGGPLSTLVSDVHLLANPTGTAIQSIAGTDGDPVIEVHIYLDTTSVDFAPYSQNLVLLIGKTPDVSLSNFLIMHSSEIGIDGAGGFVDYIYRSGLTGLFSTGDSIYITACTFNRYVHTASNPDNWYDLGNSCYYVDPDSGDYVYPNLSTPPAILRFPY